METPKRIFKILTFLGFWAISVSAWAIEIRCAKKEAGFHLAEQHSGVYQLAYWDIQHGITMKIREVLRCHVFSGGATGAIENGLGEEKAKYLFECWNLAQRKLVGKSYYRVTPTIGLTDRQLSKSNLSKSNLTESIGLLGQDFTIDIPIGKKLSSCTRK